MEILPLYKWDIMDHSLLLLSETSVALHRQNVVENSAGSSIVTLVTHLAENFISEWFTLFVGNRANNGLIFCWGGELRRREGAGEGDIGEKSDRWKGS